MARGIRGIDGGRWGKGSWGGGGETRKEVVVVRRVVEDADDRCNLLIYSIIKGKNGFI